MEDIVMSSMTDKQNEMFVKLKKLDGEKLMELLCGWFGVRLLTDEFYEYLRNKCVVGRRSEDDIYCANEGERVRNAYYRICDEESMFGCDVCLLRSVENGGGRPDKMSCEDYFQFLATLSHCLDLSDTSIMKDLWRI